VLSLVTRSYLPIIRFLSVPVTSESDEKRHRDMKIGFRSLAGCSKTLIFVGAGGKLVSDYAQEGSYQKDRNIGSRPVPIQPFEKSRVTVLTTTKKGSIVWTYQLCNALNMRLTASVC
jgi:hypothetical protein